MDGLKGRIVFLWKVDLFGWSQVAPPARDFLIRFAKREAAKKRHVLTGDNPTTSFSKEGLRMVWDTVLDLEQVGEEDLGLTWEFFVEGDPL